MININQIKKNARFHRVSSEFEQDGKSYILYESLSVAINLTAGIFFEGLPGVYAKVLDIEYSQGNAWLTISYRHNGRKKKKRHANQDEVWIAWIEEV